MTRREKLLGQIRNNPKQVRFQDLEKIILGRGFVIFNKRGSHITYHHRKGHLLTVVKPHGGRTHCHPEDVKKVLKVLGL
jgi:predicted RNA binding protein YcfA (HicA-like mRNA interferase family)